jgi:hypothetical protein
MVRMVVGPDTVEVVEQSQRHLVVDDALMLEQHVDEDLTKAPRTACMASRSSRVASAVGRT